MPAGKAATGTVGPGEAFRIATGAPIPPGADAVVPVEATTPLDTDGQARSSRPRRHGSRSRPRRLVHEPVETGGSIRARGSDLEEGTTLLEPGRRLSAQAIALAAGAGVAQLTVHRRPRGRRAGHRRRGPAARRTARRRPASPTRMGRDFARCSTAAGCTPLDLGIARDDLDDVLGRLRRALDEGVDAIIVSGGVSVGPFDVVKTAIEAIGRIDLWRVAVQPGKPFAFGTAARPSGGPDALVFGLPGNPVSSFVTFELFVRPALRRLAGRRDLLRAADRRRCSSLSARATAGARSSA